MAHTRAAWLAIAGRRESDAAREPRMEAVAEKWGESPGLAQTSESNLTKWAGCLHRKGQFTLQMKVMLGRRSRQSPADMPYSFANGIL